MFAEMINEIKTLNIIKMNNLDNELAKNFSFKQIDALSKTIADNNINVEVYKNKYNIQSELINNESFVGYIKGKLPISENIGTFMNKIIAKLRSENKKITDYPYELFIRLYYLHTRSKNNPDEIYTVFLERCKNIDLNNNKCAENIFNNLYYFYDIKNQQEYMLDDLSEEAFNIFAEEFVSIYFPRNKKYIKEMCVILSQNNNLRNLIRRLYEEEKGIEFSVQSFMIMNDSDVIDKISKIADICDNSGYMQNFFEYWEKDDCSKSELAAFEMYCRNESKENIENALSARIKYFNVIYGNKYPFIFELNNSNMLNSKEELYMYAVVENKKAFLKLLNENRELFESISNKSLLFSENFRKHVNINALNIKDVKDLKNMTIGNKFDTLWNSGRTFTFNEIKVLYDCEKSSMGFYLLLENPKVDDKILIMRQVKKHSLVDVCNNKQEEIEILAKRLSEKSIYNWMNTEFSHIESLEVSNAAGLLLIYGDKKELIDKIDNNTEAEFIINNSKNEFLNGITDINYLRENLLDIDISWKKLKEILKVSENFIAENIKGITDFCMRNGAYIALTYCEECNLDDSQKKAFFRVIKSVISDKFYKLKYHDEDLSAEMQFNVSKVQKDLWIKNCSVKCENISIVEADDFYATMNVGEKPIRTCISYKSGTYGEYLLSNFDSNKKIINIYVGDKIVGRSILRFTKCCYKNKKKKEKNSLEFIDVENDEDINTSLNKVQNEFLVIFLERGYFSGINKEFEAEIRKKVIEFVEKKAADMDVVPVVSDDYKKALINSDKYVYQNLYMFISLSKSGKQYLDSLGGSNSISNEGKYYYGKFILPVNR